MRRLTVTSVRRALVVATLVLVTACSSKSSEEANWSPDLWVDRAGNELPMSTIYSTLGPEHCGWQSATILSLGVTEPGAGRDHFRDPEGVFGEYTRGTYDVRAKLPADAKDTGHRRGDWALWLTTDDAYVVTPDRVERWPGSDQRPGCA